MPELLCAEPADKDQRVDVYLTKKLASLSRSQINRLIREGRVKVNGKTAKASHKIDLHDSISIEIPPPRPLGIQPEKVP
ncbi:MAG: S4 domain-containing protein, partial [Deltaproteobacteria bacterium]|nr:S4 domain-containing protein [Deltaproteobacteria bacterium]